MTPHTLRVHTPVSFDCERSCGSLSFLFTRDLEIALGAIVLWVLILSFLLVGVVFGCGFLSSVGF